MKTIFNTRILFTIFLSIALGIFAGGLYLCGEVLTASILTLLVICFVVTLTIFCVLKKFSVRTFFIILLSLMLGASLIFGFYGKMLSQTEHKSIEGTVVARVDDIENETNKSVITLSNVSVNEDNINGKIKLFIFDSLEVEAGIDIGDYIKFEGTLKANELIIDNTFNTSVFNKNVLYSGYVNTSTLQVNKAGKTVFEKIKIKTENLLNDNMDSETASICIALIFGDKSNIDDVLYKNFSYSGIAHILSVSGLHVGFIVALILFVLTKLNVKPKLQFLIVLTLLLLYCILCNFSASVLRASLMSLCVMLSLVFGKKSDILSSISLAGILLLISNPFNLYDIGFELSFASVFGIIFLAKPITKLLLKLKLPKLLADAFAVTICTTLFTYPIVANTFGFIAPISLISNLIILPIFSVYFSVLFVVFLISLILPLGALFVPLSYFFMIITFTAKLFAKFPIIHIAPINIFATCIYYITLFVFAKFVKLNLKVKAIISSCLLAVFVPLNIITQLPANFNQNQITTFAGIEQCVLITTNTNHKFLVGTGDGEDYIAQLIIKKLSSKNIRNLDAIILPNYEAKHQTSLCDIAKTFNAKAVILPQNITTENLIGISENIFDNGLITMANFDCYHLTPDITITALTYEEDYKAMLINDHLIVKGRLTEKQSLHFKQTITQNLKCIVVEAYTNAVENLKSENTNIIDKTLKQNNFCFNI